MHALVSPAVLWCPLRHTIQFSVLVLSHVQMYASRHIRLKKQVTKPSELKNADTNSKLVFVQDAAIKRIQGEAISRRDPLIIHTGNNHVAYSHYQNCIHRNVNKSCKFATLTLFFTGQKRTYPVLKGLPLPENWLDSWQDMTLSFFFRK